MRLTTREMWVLWTLAGLLLLGMVVKVYRAEHPPVRLIQPTKP